MSLRPLRTELALREREHRELREELARQEAERARLEAELSEARRASPRVPPPRVRNFARRGTPSSILRDIANFLPNSAGALAQVWKWHAHLVLSGMRCPGRATPAELDPACFVQVGSVISDSDEPMRHVRLAPRSGKGNGAAGILAGQECSGSGIT
jgi:hypothetical protein